MSLAPRIRPKVDSLRGESAQAKTRRDWLGRPRLSTCRQMRTLGAWHSIEMKWVWTNEKTFCFTTMDISCRNRSDKRWCRLESHCWWAHARRPIVTNDNRHQQIIDQQSHQLTQVHQYTGLETQQMNEWNERVTTLERNESSFVEEISWSATNTEVLTCDEVTKSGQNQQEEICCHKQETVMMSYSNKYYYAMKSQYNNISVL